MTTFVKRLLAWILPPEDAQEAAREHLRENVYIASKESIDNPPARDHVGIKDGVWDNTVDKVIQKISSPLKNPANQLKRFVCGPNPNLGDLLNAKDKDSQVVVGVQSHYPITFRKSHRKSDLFFDMKIRQRNGKIAIKHLPYKLVKELKLVHEYMRRVPALFPLVPSNRNLRTSRTTSSSSPD